MSPNFGNVGEYVGYVKNILEGPLNSGGKKREVGVAREEPEVHIVIGHFLYLVLDYKQIDFCVEQDYKQFDFYVETRL